MNIRKSLANEFIMLSIEELQVNKIELSLRAQHQVLSDWCEDYEDVPPKNRAERVVQDALVIARDSVLEMIRESRKIA